MIGELSLDDEVGNLEVGTLLRRLFDRIAGERCAVALRLLGALLDATSPRLASLSLLLAALAARDPGPSDVKRSAALDRARRTVRARAGP